MHFDSLGPGIIEFEKRGCVVKESEDLVEVRVVRRKGSDGTVGVAWTTVDLTARAGIDYESSSGFLFFQQGVVSILFFSLHYFYNCLI